MGVQENVQVVKDLSAAFGRGDIQGLLALFAEDEDIEWIVAGEGLPLAGTPMRDAHGQVPNAFAGARKGAA